MIGSSLPAGSAPAPVSLPHFPDSMHAFVWRNWTLVPIAQMAKTIGAEPEEIRRIGEAMGLTAQVRISADQKRRTCITVIRRNWHLLPYEQLLTLLGWNEKRLAFTLQEDDFLYSKLGSLKPDCPPIQYHPPDQAARAREAEIAAISKRHFDKYSTVTPEPLFAFVSRLSEPPLDRKHSSKPDVHSRPLRICYSYFGLYGDPLLDKHADPYPSGLLARMAASGINGVWLPALLYRLVPFPWDEKLSEGYAKRIACLNALVERGRRFGISLYLYLNEPRSMPLSFFDTHPDLRGVSEGDRASLCTSVPEVQRYLADGISRICVHAPDLGGFFTITASENLTNCWSHYQGANCPRCSSRGLPEVIAEVNSLIQQGIDNAAGKARLIVWDWGWPDDQTPAIIGRLPAGSSLMSVSEWGMPIKRGGIDSIVGEYSLSTIGPGPRATRHWEMARKRGLIPVAKIQIANSWELSAVPYIPALENSALHAANLRGAHIEDMMLSWTLGGYPSPNMEAASAILDDTTGSLSTDAALAQTAERRFGIQLSKRVVNLWKRCSSAFREFPFHIDLVYTAPLQTGPANLLWSEPTGYRASMVGIPYDDLDTWRSIYPEEVFISQFAKMGEQFDDAVQVYKTQLSEEQATDLDRKRALEEGDIAEAVSIIFQSVSNQAQFIAARRKLSMAVKSEEAIETINSLAQILNNEIILAVKLFEIQERDSRIGFEASNQYSFIPIDLMEKVINCQYLLDHWLAHERKRWSN